MNIRHSWRFFWPACFAALLACSSSAQRAGIPTVADSPDRAGPSRGPGTGSVQVVHGEVMGVDHVPIGDQNLLTLRLRLSPSKDPIKVRMGPGWFWDEQGLRFQPNEPISVQVSRQLVDGQPVFVATEVTKAGQRIRVPPPSPEPAEEADAPASTGDD